MAQVQFEAGQTEALLTMTTVREHSGSFLSLYCPALCQVIAETQLLRCFKEKRSEEKVT